MSQLFYDRPDPDDTEDPDDHVEDPALFNGPSPRGLADDGSTQVLYVEEPEPRRIGRWLAVLGVVVLLGMGAVAAVGLWVRGQIDPSGGTGDDVAFTIPEGSGTGVIATELATEGIITNSQVFEFYLRANGSPTFQAGDYVLQANMGMGAVVEVLEAGPGTVVTGRVTVPEGLKLTEIAAAVGENDAFSAEAFLQAATGGTVRSATQPPDKPLEGLLFPETYSLDGREDDTELLRRMVTTMDTKLAELGYDQAPARVGLTPYETVIVASLIEAEAKSDVDRRKISRVIHNRLAQNIPLGIDATFYYALDRRGGSLTQSDLDIDSPYNTRDNVGLVPTPIGAPGEASLAAAIDPEPGPWVYYVLQDPQTHAFSESYEEFQANVRRARENGLIP